MVECLAVGFVVGVFWLAMEIGKSFTNLQNLTKIWRDECWTCYFGQLMRKDPDNASKRVCFERCVWSGERFNGQRPRDTNKPSNMSKKPERPRVVQKESWLVPVNIQKYNNKLLSPEEPNLPLTAATRSENVSAIAFCPDAHTLPHPRLRQRFVPPAYRDENSNVVLQKNLRRRASAFPDLQDGA